MDIRSQIEVVLSFYPTLRYSLERNELSGELFISKYDSYQIRIELNPYPKSFPSLYETEERIPNKADRHIYSDSGACCLTTPAKAQILIKSKIKTLKLFIKEIVIPYFQNNSYYEINKKYKTEEYAHGIQGVLDSYKDILKINDEILIAKTIHDRLTKPKLKIHNDCYCGSKIKLKNCTKGSHDKAYREFKLIDKLILELDFDYNFIPLLKIMGF